MSEPYADEVFYKDDYEGTPFEAGNFSRLSKRASDIIDALTDYQVSKIGLDKFSEHVQLLIKKACCAQVEYYQIEGIQSDISGTTQSGGSLSIGGFSYSGGMQSTSKQANRVAPACLSYLEATGLLRKRSVRIGVV
ncbi:hypothetical protein [Enterococcus italicus]|uniref:hypothetical protein n=1 Tax=Enterococcus italicus TaxID=246144 RepID=UPI0028A63A51|nr:hypothetical protein [Enterococcus italicus]